MKRSAARGEGFSVKFTKKLSLRGKAQEQGDKASLEETPPVSKPLSMRDAPPVFWVESLKNSWAVNAHAYSVTQSTAVFLSRPVTLMPAALAKPTREKTPRPSSIDPKAQKLFAAARAGDCGTIRLLVMDGVDIEARDSQGRSAMNIATQSNQPAAVKTLLAAREMKRLAALGDLPDTGFFRKFTTRQSG